MQVSGWGTTSSGGSSSDELRIVTVPFVSDDGRYLILFFFSESMNITHLQKCILQTLKLVQSIIESDYYSYFLKDAKILMDEIVFTRNQ